MRRKIKPFLILTAIVIVLLGIYSFYMANALAISFFAGGEAWSIEQEPWIETSFTLPEEAVQITFQRQHAHPYLAEYYRKIQIEIPEKESIIVELPMNIGGRTLLNVYLLHEVNESNYTHLLLKEKHGEYAIELEKGILTNYYQDEFDILLDSTYSTYLGRLADEGELIFIPATVSPEKEFD